MASVDSISSQLRIITVLTHIRDWLIGVQWMMGSRTYCR